MKESEVLNKAADLCREDWDRVCETAESKPFEPIAAMRKASAGDPVWTRALRFLWRAIKGDTEFWSIDEIDQWVYPSSHEQVYSRLREAAMLAEKEGR